MPDEFEVEYFYQGKTHKMHVGSLIVGGGQTYYVVKMPSGVRNIMKKKDRWEVTSPLPIKDDLLQAIGKGIEETIKKHDGK